MLYIDEQTLAYLRLTGRSDAHGTSRSLCQSHRLWADAMDTAEYERVLEFDLSSVGRNIAGPSRPHAKVATDDLTEAGIANPELLAKARQQISKGKIPDGAVIIAAITSCTNTSNPFNMIAAGLVARNAAKKGLVRQDWVKSSLAPGSKQ